MAIIPETIPDSKLEDVQSINLQDLRKRYIDPIERLRSMSAPSSILGQGARTTEGDQAVQREIDTAQVDNNDALESRTHAFYRMLSLPVISGDQQSFYNPGFNPERTRNAATKNAQVSDNVSQNMRTMHQSRENAARTRLNTFKRGGLDASVYAAVLPIVKPFQVIDSNLTFSDAFDQKDDQTFDINTRKLFIESTFSDSDGNNITNFFESGTHKLRPFTIDPKIESTVMPSDRLVCEPFLRDKDATRLEEDTFLVRPGIEQVLRFRLRAFENTKVIRQTIFELDGVVAEVDGEETTNIDLRDTALALLAENRISGGEIRSEIIASDVEVINLTRLIRTIKGVVETLIKSIETIADVSRFLEWKPLPDERGPEFGADVAAFLRPKRRTSKIERRIRELKTKRVVTVAQTETADVDIGKFSISFLENTEKTFNDELNVLDSARLKAVEEASKSLSNIEIITGEISGLGLTDILAIYTALWAIDLETLVHMLDDAAFQRLFEFNPDLRAPAVVSRRQGGRSIDIATAMNRFEAQVISILAFADKVFSDKLGSPKNAEGGDPTTTNGS